MQNAHLRMGKLTFVKQTRDTITDVSVHLNRLVAERPAEPRLATDLHLVSVFGGDQEIEAVTAAAHEGLRFEIRARTSICTAHSARSLSSTGRHSRSPGRSGRCDM